MFIDQLSPFIKVKYLIYLPVMAFVAFFLALNIGFNWAEYQYFKTAEQSFSEDFLTEKESLVKLRKYSGEIDIFLKGKTQPILKNVGVKEVFCSKEKQKSENKFQYYYFPFEHPYCFDYLLNLDSDSEPEIIFRYESELQYRVYDFDASTKTFIVKPISAFSRILRQYINIVTLNGVSWKYWLQMDFIFLLGYLAVAGSILLIFNSAKKSLRKPK